MDIAVLMSVLIDPEKRYLYGGGIERIVFTLFPYLAKKHNIEVFAPSAKKENKTFEYKGMKVHLLGKNFKIPKHERAVAKVSIENFDVILYTDPFSAFFNSKLKGKKITLVHNIIPRSVLREDYPLWAIEIIKFLEWRMLKRAIKISDKIVSISPVALPHLKKLGAKEVKVLGVGIEFPKRMGKKEKIGVCIGRIYRYKGVFEMAEALSNLDLEVIIAGRGPVGEELKDFVRKFENVKYLGYISEETKRRLLEKALIYISMSKSENFGIAPLEGGAYACYPLLREIQAFKYVFDGIEGIFVKNGKELRKKAEELVRNFEETVRKGKKIRKILKKRWEAKKVAEDYEKIIEC